MTRTARRRGSNGAATRERTEERPAENRQAPPGGRAEGRPAAATPKRASFWQKLLHDRSVRARVAALVLLPTIGTLVLGAFFVKNAWDDATAASDVENLATVGLSAADLFHAIQDERDLSTLESAGGQYNVTKEDSRAATDQARNQFEADLDSIRDSDLGQEVVDAVANYDRDVGQIDSLRDRDDDTAFSDPSGTNAYSRASESVAGLIVAASAVVQEPDSARLLRALNDITQATEAASAERATFALYMEKGQPVEAEDALDQAATLQAEQELLITNFLDSIDDPVQRRELADQISNANLAITPERLDINKGTPARSSNVEWYENSSSRLETLREIGVEVATDVVDDAAATTTSARLTAGISAAGVLVVLALTVILTLVVARSIIGPLRRLRAAAHDTATTNLPALVGRIQQDGPAATRDSAVAVAPEGRDEIGEVASAFNDVHATAVRVAGEQALLRQNLDTIVVNLSRRTQSLVDRQLSEIEGLESRERDPDQLSTLFRIDHIATRVRRHAESLLILAGVEEMRRQSSASPILDIVRAAVGEVEQYPRVEFGVMPTDLVAATAVDDIAHLLAELIDNATEFSAPSTPVTITSQPLLGGGLRIQVTDSGLGVPADQLADLNSRLASPGDIDVAASRTLGLYVVARLANKHGIQVRMEPAGNQGTVANVDLPSSLILSPLDTTEGVIPAVTAEPETQEGQQDAILPAFPQVANAQEILPQRPQQRPAPDRPPARPGEPARRPGALPQRPRVGEAPASRPDTGQHPAVPGSLWAHQEPSKPASNGNSSPGRPLPGVPTGTQPGGKASTQPIAASETPASASESTGPLPTVDTDSAQAASSSLRAPQPELPSSETPVYDAMASAWFRKGKMPRDWSSPADAGWQRAAEALRAAEQAAGPGGRPEQNEPAAYAQPQAREPELRPQPLQRRPAPEPQQPARSRPEPAAPEPGAGWTHGGQPGPAADERVLHASGLPVRRKGASLVPGSIDVPGATPQPDAEPAAASAPDASNVASTLSSLQRGVSRGREETGGWVPKRPSSPGKE